MEIIGINDFRISLKIWHLLHGNIFYLFTQHRAQDIIHLLCHPNTLACSRERLLRSPTRSQEWGLAVLPFSELMGSQPGIERLQ